MQTDNNTPKDETASVREIAKSVPSVRRGSKHFILVHGVLTQVTRAEYVEYLQREKSRGSAREARS